MVSNPTSRESPASRRILSRTLATTALNSKCQDPASRSMACFTGKLVVNGPGVKSVLSFAEGRSGTREGFASLMFLPIGWVVLELTTERGVTRRLVDLFFATVIVSFMTAALCHSPFFFF